MERVEALEVVREVVAVGVGLGDHHHRRVRQRAAGEHQQLEDVVERRGVRAAGAHDRHDLLEVEAEQLGGQLRLAGAHPVRVAHQRVDLAVVGDDAERVREVPARERVRREAGVHERQRGAEALVLEVGVEVRSWWEISIPLYTHVREEKLGA